MSNLATDWWESAPATPKPRRPAPPPATIPIAQAWCGWDESADAGEVPLYCDFVVYLPAPHGKGEPVRQHRRPVQDGGDVPPGRYSWVGDFVSRPSLWASPDEQLAAIRELGRVTELATLCRARADEIAERMKRPEAPA